jgi:hypothetical protein
LRIDHHDAESYYLAFERFGSHRKHLDNPYWEVNSLKTEDTLKIMKNGNI